LQQCSGRRNADGEILDSQSGQDMHMKMTHQAFFTGIVVKIMSFQRIYGNF
jgi:hypothetical protein